MNVPPTELDLLCRHARHAPVVVTIGTGDVSSAIAENTSSEIYAVDTAGTSGAEWMARLGHLRGRILGRTRNLTLLGGSSEEVAACFDLPIDLLLIDSTESRRDWKRWTPKVRPGGIIAVRIEGAPGIAALPIAQDESDVYRIDGTGSLTLFRKRTSVPPLSHIELTVNRPIPLHPSRAA